MTRMGLGAGAGRAPLVWLILTLGLGCASAGPPCHLPSHTSKRGVSIALATGPFGALLAPVLLNGSHRVWMLIDTGASTSSLDRSVARELGLAERESENLTIGIGGSSAGGGVAVQQLQVAGVSYGPIDFHVLDLSELRRAEQERGGPRTDGILGADFLAPLLAVIDYGGRRLVLTAPLDDARQFYIEGVVAFAALGAPSALTPLKSWPKQIAAPVAGAKVWVKTAQGRVQTARTDPRGRFKLGPITAGALRSVRSLSISHDGAEPYSVQEPAGFLAAPRSRLLISIVPAPSGSD